jgi:methionine synthase II (cobalamin-independent)
VLIVMGQDVINMICTCRKFDGHNVRFINNQVLCNGCDKQIMTGIVEVEEVKSVAEINKRITELLKLCASEDKMLKEQDTMAFQRGEVSYNTLNNYKLELKVLKWVLGL